MRKKVDQASAPLFEAMVSHLDRVRGNFHVPGHKQGQAFDEAGRSFFGEVLKLDLTELPSLDDLHHPQGPIEEAQALAAEAFGADHTFFLVGGSTAGNLAMILSCCQPGDRLIVQRNSHQSVFHGCMLAGVRPVYLGGRPMGEEGEVRRMDPRDLREVLSRFPEVKGVFLTCPDYFGVNQPLEELADICHQHGIPLLVDEAHGAHFGFHPSLPRPAVLRGADAAVQSTHKMLPAMTMASMLHLKGGRLCKERVAHWLRVLQSSSPSYPLMASLDLARRYLFRHGRERMERVLNRLEEVREALALLTALEEWKPGPSGDPMKLVFRSKRRIRGQAMLHWLEERGCYLEMADHRRVLSVFSVGSTEEEIRRLREQLKGLDQEVGRWPEAPPVPSPTLPLWSESRFSLDEAGRMKRIPVVLEEAEGRTAADMVVPYPPGIPVILPGERFTAETVNYIREVIRAGGRVRGAGSGSPPRVHVLQ